MKLNNALGRAAAVVIAAAGLTTAQDTLNMLYPYENVQGFQRMFDGLDANSFRSLFANYTQNNTTNTNLHAGWSINTAQTDPDRPGATFASIVNSGGSGGNANIDIRSRRLYRDFDWRFEYRNSGNQGVIYRFGVTGQYAWETGIEFAIENNTSAAANTLTGAAYDLIAPSSQPYQVRSTNKWNKVRIVAKGDSVEHWVNDVKVVSFRYWSTAFLAAYNRPSKWTGYPRFCQTANNNRTYIPEGYIGLQGDHGGAWQIRRIRILHDSVPGMDRVKLGPIDTSLSSSIATPARGARASFRLESLAGRLHVSSGEALRSVVLQGLDGRVARREAIAGSRTEHAVETASLPRGLYLVRLETETGAVRHARTLIN